VRERPPSRLAVARERGIDVSALPYRSRATAAREKSRPRVNKETV
jgi:hypothetical protein